MSDIKLCVDCQYYLPKKVALMGSQMEDRHWCVYDRVEHTDVVTGSKYFTGEVNCYTMRSKNGKCGPSGRLFELKR